MKLTDRLTSVPRLVLVSDFAHETMFVCVVANLHIFL